MLRRLSTLGAIALISMIVGIAVGWVVLPLAQPALADGCYCIEEDDCYYYVLGSPCETGMVRTFMRPGWEYCNGIPTYQCCGGIPVLVEGCHWPD